MMPITHKKITLKLVVIALIFLFTTSDLYALDMIAGPEVVGVSASVGVITITPIDEGGGGITTNAIFRGQAYPGATVHVWKDGVPKQTTIADNRGYFTITLPETYNPSVLYTLYAVDTEGRKSLLINYPLVIKTGYLLQVSGIRFAPTIGIDKTEVKFGDYLNVSGFSMPNTPIDIQISGLQSVMYHLKSKNDGSYKIMIPLQGLEKGTYDIYSSYENDKKISKVLKFTIGNTNILSIDLTTNIPGDCNADQVINLIDFSVVAFWYGKSNPPRCVDTNSDDLINLIDFSILAFYWTG